MTQTNKSIFAGLIPLSSIAFFNPGGAITDQLGKLMFLTVCCLVMIVLLFVWTPRLRKFPKLGYVLMLCGVFSGVAVTVIIHGQTITTGVVSVLPLLFAYGTFFIFYKLNITKGKFIRLVRYLAISGIIIYFINRLFYPNLLFGVKEGGMRAGMLRMWIPFLELDILLFFYYINDFARNGIRRISLVYVLLFGTMIILSVTRQLIILGFGLGAILYILRTRGAAKIIVAMLIAVFTITVIPNTRIFEVITETTESENERSRGAENNVRLLAWNFYTDDVQESIITKVFGNGVPAFQKSKWGHKIDQISDRNGWYPTDVGWAGFFFNFGLTGVIGLLIILLSSLIKSVQNGLPWISVWLILILVSSFTSGPILYTYQIVSISMVLYLIYGNNGSYHFRI